MKKLILLILILFLYLSTFLLSCSKQASFGNIVIASEVLPADFTPAVENNTFHIDDDAIYAVIRVTNAYSYSKWRFLWKKLGSDETIMDQSDYYNIQKKQYIDGNISTFLPLKENEKAILMPGKYEVFFYHEDELQSIAVFEVKSPEIKIMDTFISKSIDENMEPIELTEAFYSSDTVYVSLKTNYQIPDNRLTVKYFSSEGDLLTSSSIILKDYYFDESFSVFSLSGESGLLTPGEYSIEVYLNEDFYNAYSLKVQASAEDIKYSLGNIYENEEFSFAINYPDGWDYVEDLQEETLKIDFMPSEAGLSMALVMHVIKKDYFPAREDLVLFAKEFSEDIADENGFELIDANEMKMTLEDDIDYDKFVFEYEKKEDGSFWSAIFSFLNKQDLYMLMSLSEREYGEASAYLHETVMESIRFE